MRRRLCIFLLMLLPLHGFAMQGGWLSAGNMFDIAHEIAHLEGKRHHHHSGVDAPHFDDSAESAANFADHSTCQHSVSLPSVAMPLLAIQPFTIKLHELAYYLPDPFLEDPQRPPASLG